MGKEQVNEEQRTNSLGIFLKSPIPTGVMLLVVLCMVVATFMLSLWVLGLDGEELDPERIRELTVNPRHLCNLHLVGDDVSDYNLYSIPTVDTGLRLSPGWVCATHNYDETWSRIVLLDGSAVEGYIPRDSLLAPTSEASTVINQ